MTRKGPILGLDFGTTNTAAAWFDGRGELHLVPVRDGVHTLPSVVCFHGGGSVLVGEPARQLMADVPAQTLYGVKRLMGRRFLSDYVGRHRSRFPFHLVEGEDGEVAAEIRGERVPLEDVAGHIVSRIVELAEIDAGEKIDECVITVPAHFMHRQRRVIRTAVSKAGLRVRAMVNEPTAAALYHARVHGTDAETMLVYDLGGGTFDTTLLRVRRGLTEVLATGGEAFLGGSDFDARIIDELMERFENEHGVNLRHDQAVQQRLLLAAELAKIALSEERTTTLRVPCVAVKDDNFLDLEVELSRRELEKMVAPLIERTIGITLQVVGHAGLNADDVDEVVLVGGQTKMPAVRERLAAVLKVGGSGPRIAESVDAELGVAIGAATFGYGAQVMIDVNAVPVGLMIPGHGPQEAIRRNTPLPCVRKVSLQRPDSGPLPVVVYESVEATSIDRDILGRLTIGEDWLKANPGPLSLEVRMSSGFELDFTVETEGGDREALELLPVNKEPSAPAPSTAPDAIRSRRREEHHIEVKLRMPSGERTEKTENLSAGGMFIATTEAAPVGTVLPCTLGLGSGALELRARVVHVLDEQTAATIGQVAGMGLSFVDIHPAQERAILQDIDRGQVSAVQDEGTLDPPDDAAPEDPVLTFVQGVAAQDFYAALGVDPLAGHGDLRARYRVVQQTLSERLAGAEGGPEGAAAQRIQRIARILARVGKVLGEPRRRLEYDFQQGHDFIEERCARAAAEKGPSMALLREAWRKVHPGPSNEASILVARALKAAREGDLVTATSTVESALERDPFDEEMRAKLAEWRAMMGKPGP